MYSREQAEGLRIRPLPSRLQPVRSRRTLLGRLSTDVQSQPILWVRRTAFFLVMLVLTLIVATWGQPLGIATSRRRDAFTEVYFNDPSGSSTFIHKGKLSLSFTIRNDEGRPMTYAYKLSLNARRVLNSTTPPIPASGHYTVQQQLRLPTGQKPVEVSVQLANGQTIRTWINREKR